MAPDSRDEVRQRINTLYDRAENATGNFNATRAMSAGSRTRGVPLRKPAGAGADPGVDAMTRQWFDTARGKRGPSVPAALPADRMPRQRTSGSRSTAASGGALPGAEPELTDRALRDLGLAPELPELTAGAPGRAVAELPGGRATAELPSGRAIAELPGSPAAALPAVPEPRREPTRVRPSPAAAKAENQRKLAAASDVLSRHALRHPAPIAAIEAPPVRESWFPAQQSSTPDTFASGGVPAIAPPSPANVPDPLTDPLTDTGPLTFATNPSPFTDTGALPVVPLTDTGTYAPVTGPVPSLYPDTAVYTPVATPDPLTDPLTDTGPLTFATNPSPFTDTGALPVVPVTGTYAPAAVPQSTFAGKATKALEFARAQIGKPCLWGATGPDSYDCSSLTQAAWKVAGVALPRSAADQAGAGTPVSTAEIQAGDLIVFFDNATHVGISTGNGMMVHAPGPGAFIREESIYGAGESAIRAVVRPA
ncbi:NlpC/P60 family protein [Streptomyces sp. NPDC086787]|uniref:C40 family peptidase n=1 Tax=Streptomyces sp. NPDC086787 TaxID=3365759 RepID=UPI00381894C2